MPDKIIVAIDSQRLEAMQSCMMFYDYRFNKSLVPINTPDYLERGSLIHHMLAQFYKMRKYQSRWYINGKSYRDIVDICIRVGRSEALSLGLDIAEVEDVIEVFKQYTDLWENDSWTDIVGVEQTSAKVLYDSDSLTILYEAKMDLVLRIGGNITAIDHKHSKSRRDPNQLSNQFKGYCWSLGNNNLIVNEIGFQKTIKPVEKFRRHMLSFPDSIIEEWKRNTIFWVKFTLGCTDSGIYPRNFSSCDKFSGCDFRHICSAEPGDLREFRLRKDFKEKVWDVGGKHL